MKGGPTKGPGKNLNNHHRVRTGVLSYVPKRGKREDGATGRQKGRGGSSRRQQGAYGKDRKRKIQLSSENTSYDKSNARWEGARIAVE